MNWERRQAPSDYLNGEEVIEQAQRRVRVAIGAIGMLVLLGVAFGLALLLPYTPMTVYNYYPSKTEVCPSTIMSVMVDYEIERTPIGRGVREVEADPLWIVEDVEGLEPGEVLKREESEWAPHLLEPGHRTTRSTVLRITPPKAGEWRPAVELTVRGRGVFGIPGVQEIRRETHETVTVLPFDHPSCVKETP